MVISMLFTNLHMFKEYVVQKILGKMNYRTSSWLGQEESMYFAFYREP